MSPNIPYALKPREITVYLYQRSRPAIVSEKKKKKKSCRRVCDRCNVRTVQYGRLLAYAYDPRDVSGTCRHDRMAVLGSKMSTSGTRGLGFSSWMHKRSDEAVGFTTDVCSKSNAAAVSIPDVPGPRVVKLT